MTDHDSCQWKWGILYADRTYMELSKTSHTATLVDCLLNLEPVTRVWGRWVWSYHLATKVMEWVWSKETVVLTIELTPEQVVQLHPDSWLDAIDEDEDDGQAEV